ncbi:TauD/TfdA family dioxygenase [Streptomyces sp. NPDC019922]|uniref:TauD/TfdA dioxygenase family protein n=1 Tax=unclassified Streptomyces TaxID=2593676 RepID=UPI001368E580|nr:TauD/TfdA family dioxygenase [Streptomyces sp. SID7834]MYT60109.1 TauD/TfdA family dioxygenase [Streptomyces sp. SID7834]
MSLSLRPLDDSGFGAVVDCDLATEADDLAPQLARALHEHRLLVVPRQHLTHADLLTVASCFGTVDTNIDRRYAVGGFPGLTVISNIVEDGKHVGIYDGDDEEEWHADNSFKPQLTAATLLYSVITPEKGGETRFADATRAYAALPPAARQRIEEMRAVHSIEQLGALQSQASGGQSSAAAGSLASHPEVEHPLVLTHPVTGARSLLLGSMVIRCVTGLSEQDSRALVDDLLEHTTRAPYLYSHRWSQGDLVVWDNLATLHTASPCDSSRHPRLLYRAAVRQHADFRGSEG